MALLEVKNLCYSYEKNKPTLKNVSFCVEKGEHVAIIGHNGSGKSTLAKLLNALLTPLSGTVTVDGFSSADKKSLFEIRKRVGLVFQNPDNQLIASIVEDDVAFGPENIGLKREEIKERIDFALNAVGMQDFIKASPMRLSGGQKQRIAIAGVLALKPKILVLDESTAMLDPAGREEIKKVIETLKNEGVTVISITHYMDEAVTADRIFVLSKGEIIKIGNAKEIFSDRETLKAALLSVPLATAVADKLKENGVKINGEIFTASDLGAALCKLP